MVLLRFCLCRGLQKYQIQVWQAANTGRCMAPLVPDIYFSADRFGNWRSTLY